MAPLSAISSAPMVAAARTPRTVSRLAATAAPVSRQQDDEKMGVVAYLLQGSAFIGFLLVLFVLAGFRG